jgi:hypothetical protein
MILTCLVYKSIEYIEVLEIKIATIFEDHCQSPLDPQHEING